ncbi:unnamed protein product, partial [Closterium sp. NIES-54]
PTITRFLATAVTDPLFESTAASALVAELVDFAAAFCLDYATSLVAESASASVCPPTVTARVRGQGHERYFLLVVDDYSHYTTVFPLRSKGEVTEVMIDWIRGARRQLSESFGSDLPVLRLHSDRGGEFSSDLLRAFCRLEGICLTFTLLASPQQNGIAERRIGMVMDVARTSMIHAATLRTDQPSASCLLVGDHTYFAVDGEGWRCVRVPCLGISRFCPRYYSGQAVLPCRSLCLPWLPS